jgi:hypothetical protein
MSYEDKDKTETLLELPSEALVAQGTAPLLPAGRSEGVERHLLLMCYRWNGWRLDQP